MRYDSEVAAAIGKWAPTYNVTIDPALVHAIIAKESSHGARLVTDEGGGRRSYGPMMVLDSTAAALGSRNPPALQHPALGIYYGVKYLASLLRQFGGDVARAVAAYNAGPDVRRGPTGRFPNQSYVDRVLSFWQRFKRLAVGAAPAAAVIAVVALLWFLASRRRRLA